MSSNEYIEEATTNQEPSKKRRKSKRKKGKNRKGASNGRLVVQIMNGEFMSRDWFIRNLPFTLYSAFLLVVLIGWGYYGETMTKKEVQLQEKLSKLNSEYFTLSSEYISKRGRQEIKHRLEGSGLMESRVSPKKIRVRKYVFK